MNIGNYRRERHEQEKGMMNFFPNVIRNLLGMLSQDGKCHAIALPQAATEKDRSSPSNAAHEYLNNPSSKPSPSPLS